MLEAVRVEPLGAKHWLLCKDFCILLYVASKPRLKVTTSLFGTLYDICSTFLLVSNIFWSCCRWYSMALFGTLLLFGTVWYILLLYMLLGIPT